MKRRNGLIIPVAILMLLVIVYFILDMIQFNNQNESNKKREIFSRPKSEITSVVLMPIDRDGESYKIESNGEEYLIKDYGEFKFDQQKFDNLFNACATVTAERVIDVVDADLSEYGLDIPEMKLTIEYEDGSTQTLSIGIAAQLSESRYAYHEDEKVIFLMNYQQANQMLALPEDYRIAEVIPETWGRESENIAYLRVSRNDRQSMLELFKRASGDQVLEGSSQYYFKSPYLLDAIDDVVERQLLVPALGIGENARVVADFPSTAMLKIYSLDNPSVIEMHNTENEKIEILIGGRVGDFVFIKISDRTPVMIIPVDQIGFLKYKKFDLINKTLIDISSKSIDGLEITTSEDSYLIRKDKDYKERISINNDVLTKANTDKLMELLSKLKLSGETTNEVKQDKEVLCTIKVFNDDREKENTVTLLPVDNRRSLIFYNEIKTEFYIDMQSVTTLIEWLRYYPC